jgi:hypothetical protein
MNPCSLPAVASPTLDEHFRAVVGLPKNTTFYGDCHYIAISWDRANDRMPVQPSVLFQRPNGLPYFLEHRLIGMLCASRAGHSVDGTLRVQGQIVTPEAYLGLWRAALADVISPSQLANRCGLRILVTLGAALETVRTAKSPWTSSPFETFAAFESAYGKRFTSTTMSDGRPGFELTLDLREPDAACHTFYAHALIDRSTEAASYVHTRLASSGLSSELPPSAHSQISLLESVPQ